MGAKGPTVAKALVPRAKLSHARHQANPHARSLQGRVCRNGLERL